MTREAAAIALGLVLSGCSGSSPTEPAGGGGEPLDQVLETAHFTLRYSAPSRSVEGPNRFHVVALPYDARLPVHEFAHDVTLHLAPGVANNPIWLWEATAVFEADQFVAPSSLPALVAGDFPALAELGRGAGVSIYDVGFTIGEYIVARRGIDGLRRLLVAQGDTLAALGVTFDQFERGWRDFVTARYL